MIALLTALGLSESISRRLAPFVAILAALLILGLLWAVWDHFDDKEAIDRDRLEANADALEGQAKAEAAAAAERARNIVTNFEQTGEFHDAIHDPRAGDSADPAVRLACQQLRNDGQDTTAIPECGRR